MKNGENDLVNKSSKDDRANPPNQISVKRYIRRRNLRIIGIMGFIVAFSVIILLFILKDQRKLNELNNRQEEIMQLMVDQTQWITHLQTAVNDVLTSSEYNGNLAAETSVYYIWYQELDKKYITDSQLLNELEEKLKLNEEIYQYASEAIEIGKLISKNASRIIDNDVVPRTNELMETLEKVNDHFELKCRSAETVLNTTIISSMFVYFLLAAGAIIVSLNNTRVTVEKISGPILSVAEWAEKLSQGAEDLSFDNNELSKIDLSELLVMMNAFEDMAESIRENVRVVQKVADGDLTAYVKIRSAEDSLGKSLYRMVQSNDLMFAKIVDVSDSVSLEAQGIAKASHALAENCSIQAVAIQDFSAKIDKTSELVIENSIEAQKAMEVSSNIKTVVEDGTLKMDDLLSAMQEIQSASIAVSGVITKIEEIASQTNLLALNASIEAARAGEAGKGFVVVANNVRDLAEKSKQAVDESKILIDNTLVKTEVGSKISSDTSKTFETIVRNIDSVVEVTKKIADTSEIQKDNMKSIQTDINEISDAVEGNAAASEESAASSEELNNSADMLRDSMSQFHLRERKPGQPYIPPEKKNDSAFIEEAKRNYEKAVKAGKIPIR